MDIDKAIEVVKRFSPDMYHMSPQEYIELKSALQILLTLATSYQSVKGLPKEKKDKDFRGISFSSYNSANIHNACLSACKLALLKMRPTKKDLMKYIPEVYGDIYPSCIEVNGYTKDGTVYKIRQERGEDLADALLKEWDRRMR